MKSSRKIGDVEDTYRHDDDGSRFPAVVSIGLVYGERSSKSGICGRWSRGVFADALEAVVNGVGPEHSQVAASLADVILRQPNGQGASRDTELRSIRAAIFAPPHFMFTTDLTAVGTSAFASQTT